MNAELLNLFSGVRGRDYSPKSTFEILHIRRPTGPTTPDNPAPWPIAGTHMSWCRIKMRSLA